MSCPNCTYQNEPNSAFCQECGYKLSKLKIAKNNKTSSPIKEFENEIQDVLFTPKKGSRHLIRNIGLGFVVIIIMILGIAYYGNSSNSNNTNSNNSNTQSDQNVDNWQSFKSIEFSFNISFPNFPETTRLPETTGKGVTYSGTEYVSTDKNNDAYAVYAYTYNINPTNYDNKTGLEAMANFFNEPSADKKYNYQLTDSSFTKYRGYDAVNFSFIETNYNYHGKGITFIRDDLPNVQAFTIVHISSGNQLLNFDRFINSFDFTR